MNEKELGQTLNTTDTAKPEAGGRPDLSEADKKKLELGGLMEHEHGEKRERLEEEIEKLDA